MPDSKNRIPVTQLTIIVIIILAGSLWYINSKSHVENINDDSTEIETEKPIEETETEPEIEPEEPEEPTPEPNTVTWKSLNGPSGGAVPLLALNPERPNELYAGSFPGLYISEDQGETFSELVNASYGPLNSLGAYRDTLYFTTDNAYSINIDGGEPELLREKKTQLWIQDGRVYVAEVIYHEEDLQIKLEYSELDSNTEDWTPLPSLDNVYSTITSAYQGSIVLTPEIFLGNLIATKNGLTFTIGINDLEGRYHFLENQLVILDESDIWNFIELGLDDELCVSKISQDPMDPDHLIMVLRYREIGEKPLKPLKELIKESKDGGYTWAQYTEIEDPPTYLIKDADIIDGSLYLPHVQDFIVRIYGEDHDEIELIPMANYQNQIIWLDQLVFNASNPSIVYGQPDIEFGHTGLLGTKDGMKTWKVIGNGIPSAQVSNVAVHPINGDIILTSSNIGHYPHITRDGGKTWSKIPNVANMGDELVIDPHNPEHMILVTESTRFYETWNGGYNWSRVSNQFSSARISDIVIHENSLYASIFGMGISSYDRLNEMNEFIGTEIQDENWLHIYNSSDYAYDMEIGLDNRLYATYSPKIFENHSALFSYNPDMEEWKQILKVENSNGMTSVKLDHNTSGRVIAASVGTRGIIHQSLDYGETWAPLTDSLTFSSIHEIASDPRNNGIVYAAPWGGGLFKTGNHGQDWEKLECPSVSIAAVILDPENPDHIVIGDREKPAIYESFNQGLDWETLIELDPQSYYRISDICFAYNTIVFSVFNRFDGRTGVYSDNPMSGTTFRIIDSGLETLEGDLSRAVIDFAYNGEDLHAVSHIKDVYRYEDTWKTVSTDLPPLGFNSMTIEPDNVLYLSGGCDIDLTGERRFEDDSLVNNIYRSYDYGVSWHPLLEGNPFETGIKELLFSELDPDIWIAATGTGFYVSIDQGTTWREENHGLFFLNIGSVTQSGEYIYAGTLGGGVYTGIVTPVGNIEWMRSEGPYPEIFNIQLQIDPSNSDTIFASAYPGGVYKSKDSGETWIESNFAVPSFQVSDPQIQGYYSLEIDPNNPETIYLGFFEGGVYKSTNGGAVWMPLYGVSDEGYLLMNSGVRKIKVDQSSGDIYVVSDTGVFYSEDGGANWAHLVEGLDTWDIQTIEVSDIGDVFIGTNGYGLYLLDKETYSWMHLGRPLGFGEWAPWERRLYQYSAILFDPDTPSRIYYGNFPSGFFITENNGETWQCNSLGLGNDGIFSLTYHPDNHETLFAGTYNGVWKSIDGGISWTDSSKGMPDEQWPFTVAIDSSNPDIMYTATKNGQNKGFMQRNTFGGVVMKSTDGGETWFKIMNGLRDMSEYYVILIHPLDHNMLFVSSSYGVYVSRDAGVSWESMNLGLPVEHHFLRDNVAMNLQFTPDNMNLIYGVVNYGVWKANISSLFN